MSLTELKSLLQTYGQEHLLQFWDEITEQEREALTNDIKSLDLDEVSALFSRATSSNNNKERLLDDKVKPIPSNKLESVLNLSPEKEISYENLGLEEIANGKAAVMLLAGGQGTRLGVDFPKGMYDVNLPSKRTLFHLQALRIKRLQQMAEDKFKRCKGITWYIMTSEATHDQTVAYFAKNDYFGLDKNQIVAFKQSTLPCFTFDGKMILDEKHRVSKAPDGNGGLYISLKKQGILNDMRERGINSVHAFSVDNILVKVADPRFLGYCISRSADCGVKVVTKRSADEPLGVVCLVDEIWTVVEYSEISTVTAELRDDNGELTFNSGNICNHYFTTAFLNNIAEKHHDSLDLHVAKKKIPYVDEKGARCKPNAPNGIKIEKFVFDVFKYSENFAAWEVLREDEFSGLKNSDSAKIDCPSTARSHLLNLHKKWLLNAGATEVDGDVEICPLLSYGGENLSQIAKGKSFKGPLCLM